MADDAFNPANTPLAEGPERSAPPAPELLTSAEGRLRDPGASRADRTYCWIMHLTPLLLLPLTGLSVVMPIIMWQVRKTSSPFIHDHGREAVNFHISLMVYALAGFPLSPFCGVGVGVWIAAGILAVVGMVMACIASENGEYFRYPMCIRFLGPNN